jgi:flagellar hook protein FlgE
MIGALGSAASGLRDAFVRLEVAAHNVANVDTPGFAPSRVVSLEARGGGVVPTVPADPPLVPGVDLATELIGLIVARIAAAASAAAVRTAAEVEGALVDRLG